jgi:hypothetical protein
VQCAHYKQLEPGGQSLVERVHVFAADLLR